MTAVDATHPPEPRDPWGPRQRAMRTRTWNDLWGTWLRQRDRDFVNPTEFAIAIADHAFQVAYEGLIGLAAIADGLDRVADALERERS